MNRDECEDTEEMRQWRYISQKKGVNEQWKELCGKMEVEVLGKYQEFVGERTRTRK